MIDDGRRAGRLSQGSSPIPFSRGFLCVQNASSCRRMITRTRIRPPRRGFEQSTGLVGKTRIHSLYPHFHDDQLVRVPPRAFQGSLLAFNSCDVVGETTGMVGHSGLPFCPPEIFLVIQTSPPRFGIPTRLTSPKQVSSNLSRSRRLRRVLINLFPTSTESDRSRPLQTSSPSPNPKPPQAYGANLNQSSSLDV